MANVLVLKALGTDDCGMSVFVIVDQRIDECLVKNKTLFVSSGGVEICSVDYPEFRVDKGKPRLFIRGYITGCNNREIVVPSEYIDAVITAVREFTGGGGITDF